MKTKESSKSRNCSTENLKENVHRNFFINFYERIKVRLKFSVNWTLINKNDMLDIGVCSMKSLLLKVKRT